MIIIHVITSFGIGGAEKLLLDIVNKQVEKHTVHLIYLKPINDLITKIDKRVVINHLPLNFYTSKNLASYYKKNNPDIIHTHLGHADILGLWSAKKLNAKVFCTMHNIYFKQNILDSLFFKIYRYLFLKRLPNCKVISISKSVKNHVENRLKVPQRRSFLLYNAIDFKKIEKKRNQKPVRLLFVGRLEKQKSIKTLLKAIKVLQEHLEYDFNLTIVGDGSLRQQLEALTNKLQIEKFVIFSGKQENIDSFYKESDIFILPSIWEGFGIVILEAFRAKLAVVASNIEGPAELIDNGVNGLLFQPKNHIELAEKVKLLIENKTLRDQLAENAFQTFTHHFHIDTYVEKLEKLYFND